MTDPGASALTTHELLLALAGRVDDDLLAASRELVAIGEDGQALELLTATLIADRAVLPPQVRDAVVTAGRALRIGLDADQALPRPAREDGTAHRFQADAESPGGSVRIGEVLTGPAARQLDGCRTWLTWRVTPAGSAPGPVPHPVVLVEIGGNGGDSEDGGNDTAPGPGSHATADVLAYQLAATLDRAGTRASVEAFVAGSALPHYHAEALSSARPMPAQAGSTNARRTPEPARAAEGDRPAGQGLGAPLPAPSAGLVTLLGIGEDGARPHRAGGSGAGRVGRRSADRFRDDQPSPARHEVERSEPEPPGSEAPAANRGGADRRPRNGRTSNGHVAPARPDDAAPERSVERSGATPRPAPQPAPSPAGPAGVPPLGLVPPADTVPPRPAVPLRPTPGPSPSARPTPVDGAPAAKAPAQQTDEDPSGVSETARFAARPPAAESPSPSASPAVRSVDPRGADRDGVPSALDVPRPTPSPRPAADTPDETAGEADATRNTQDTPDSDNTGETDPPSPAEMNDPLSGPLRQPLLDPLLDPTFGTTSVPSVSSVPSEPSVLTPLPPPSMEADRAAADERGRGWADEWASGDWAMPASRPGNGHGAVDEGQPERPAPRPAPVRRPDSSATGRRRARHRSDLDTEQGLDPGPVAPSEDAADDEAEPAAERASGADDSSQDAMSTLSSTERELLRQLHAELAARERHPRPGRTAATNGSNGSANGVTPPRRIGPPDLAG